MATREKYELVDWLDSQVDGELPLFDAWLTFSLEYCVNSSSMSAKLAPVSSILILFWSSVTDCDSSFDAELLGKLEDEASDELSEYKMISSVRTSDMESNFRFVLASL